ncbi:MAG: LemA family protein [Terriglobales bacterium]
MASYSTNPPWRWEDRGAWGRAKTPPTTRISQIESHIADRRELYNDAVNTFNIRIAQLPDVFVARMLAYTPRPLFIATAAERADVSVSMS